MNGHVLAFDSYAVMGQWLDRASALWPDIREDALLGALVNGRLLGDIYRRTPKSYRARYAKTSRDAFKKYSKGGVGLSSGWQRHHSQSALDRLNRYGQERLARSLQPWKGVRTAASLRNMVRSTSGGIRFEISSDLPYARRMHEAGDLGQWTFGRDRGWSTPGTGDRFISIPAKEDAADLVQNMTRNIEAELGRRGLL